MKNRNVHNAEGQKDDPAGQDPSACFDRLFLRLVSYRLGMRVTEYMILPANRWGTAYPVCPRCHVTMEREYQSFCDRCGQRLNWDDYDDAEAIPPGTY